MYQHGYGVTQDHAVALEFYKASAAQNHAGAQNNIGFMFQKGSALIIDFTLPFHSYPYYRTGSQAGLCHSEKLVCEGKLYPQQPNSIERFPCKQFWLSPLVISIVFVPSFD